MYGCQSMHATPALCPLNDRSAVTTTDHTQLPTVKREAAVITTAVHPQLAPNEEGDKHSRFLSSVRSNMRRTPLSVPTTTTVSARSIDTEVQGFFSPASV